MRFHIPGSLSGLIDPSQDLEVLADGFLFSEGPAWHPGRQELVFSDVPGDARWTWSEEHGARRVAWPTYLGNGMAYEADGSLLVCEQVTSSLVRIHPNGLREVVAFHDEGRYLNSPNDVVVHSDGSIWFTDPNYGRWDCAVGVGRKFELDFQGVFRVPPGGGEVELVVDKGEFEQPNGLAFSPDERILYVDDRSNVKAFDVADGKLGPARLIHEDMGCEETVGTGNPDGMKVDEVGNVWCTARDGIWVLSPTGELLGLIETPEVSGNLSWGGPDLRTLYITMTTKLVRVRTRVASAPLPSHAL